jgi:hypothetical protein
MTALKDYQRLESPGLWRAGADAQRREVTVSFGEATLVISDRADRALAHWSLPAVTRANPGERPAVYHPEGDPGETLEIDEDLMIDAIERVRRSLLRRRPHPGRLRYWLMGASLAAVMAVVVFWLPGALVTHTASVVPPAKRAEIGAALLEEVSLLTGAPCRERLGRTALARFEERLLPGGGRLVILPASPRRSFHLPGGTVGIDRALVERADDPEIAAGFVLAERVRARLADPLEALLREAGPVVAFRLLTTGDMPPAALRRYAQVLMAGSSEPVPADALVAAFAAAGVRSSPFAYALDPTGESVLALIEADPFATEPPPAAILSDGEWVSLQNICPL